MSKVKDYLLEQQQEQEELELWIGYMEYLRENDLCITTKDFERMEQKHLSDSTIVNNITYDNPKGA